MQISPLPSYCIPITVHRRFNKYLQGESYISHIRSADISSPTTRHEYFSSLPAELRYLLKFSKIHNEGKDIAYAIRTRTAVAVTDASVEQKTRAAAISWIITINKEVLKIMVMLVALPFYMH